MNTPSNGETSHDTAPGFPPHSGSRRQRRHLKALLELTANPMLSSDDLGAMFHLVTEAAAATLGVERVSVWRFNHSHSAIRCVDLFKRGANRHTTEAELEAAAYPAYFTALGAGDVITAHDAIQDPRTREFRTVYLEPLGISSMLDATIRIDGGIDGVLCHEHVGKPREWTADDEGFAVALANLIARAVADHGRRQAQAALRANERRYRLLFQNSPLPAYLFDVKTLRFIDVSDSMADHYGYSREELLKMTTADIRPPGDETRLRAAIDQLTSSRQEMGIWRHRKKDGTLIDVEVSAQVIEIDGNRAGLVLAVDTTERLRVERALRESEERFRQMAENIGEVFWLFDPTSRAMLYVSPAVARIWGRPAGEFTADGRTWLENIHPLDRDRVKVSQAKLGDGEVREEYRIQRPDGTVRWIRDRAFPVRDAAGRVFRVVGVAEDVTEHKQLEQSFLRAQRLESLGRLAGGIAHDLNNILAPLMIAPQLLRTPMPQPESERILAMVERGVHRGAELVKQLLFFGRGVEGDRAVLRLKDSVREVEGILEGTLPKDCRFSAHVPKDLWLVRADATQLHQVLLNLCVNACDAMPQGGRLTVTGENRMLTEWDAHLIPDARPGPYVVMRVVDTGTGIPPALLGKIFDPFFTTKSIGKGTGLGLATVASIAKSHGGFVTVQSEPGRGSTFCVGLPALVDDASTAATVTASEEALPPDGHGEEVLVVDDEEGIRSVLKEILTQHGYLVHTAINGVDGAAAFVERAGQIKLVLADLNMPQMDGLTMLQLIRKLNPTVPVLVCSGLGHDDEWTAKIAELERIGVTNILSKPFSAPLLLQALYDGLKAKAA